MEYHNHEEWECRWNPANWGGPGKGAGKGTVQADGKGVGKGGFLMDGGKGKGKGQ